MNCNVTLPIQLGFFFSSSFKYKEKKNFHFESESGCTWGRKKEWREELCITSLLGFGTKE